MRNKILLYVLSIILLGIGIVQTIYPEKTFMFGRRWMFTEENQLTNTAKILIRMGGIIIILFSVVAFIFILVSMDLKMITMKLSM